MIAYTAEPFIRAGVVQVEPLDEVAYTGSPELSYPTATNKPDEFMVTLNICALAEEPFILAGVVQVEPSDEVA
jgi:hypothetical protein